MKEDEDPETRGWKCLWLKRSQQRKQRINPGGRKKSSTLFPRSRWSKVVEEGWGHQFQKLQNQQRDCEQRKALGIYNHTHTHTKSLVM